MRTIFQDLRYAIRQLRKSPGFTIVAVLTLTFGIGANAAIFTVVNALLLKMLPVQDPQQLVVVGDPARVNSSSNGSPRIDLFSYPLYKELRDHNAVFTSLAAAATHSRIEVNSTQEEASEEKETGRLVSGNYFHLLGLTPAAGRLLSDSDDTAPNANPVAVLSYGFWQRKFALSPSVMGQTIRLNGYPFTIVGVAPAGFQGDVVGEQMALFVPISMQEQIIRGRQWLTSPNNSWLLLIGRLKPSLTPGQAAANLNIVFQQAMQGSYGASLSSDDRKGIEEDHLTIHVSAGGTGLSALRSDYRIPLLLLMGIVGLVLLIACVNVANLLLARASARNREIAVRLAIGANWSRLLKQLLTESIFLAFVGGIAGSLLAIWGVRLLVTTFGATSGDLPLVPDWRVLAFTFGITLITGVLFGLFPALRALRVPIAPTLKESVRTTAVRQRGFTLGKSLIVGQVALSLLVLFAACLLVRSLQKLMAQDFGYDRDRLVIARLDPAAGGYNNQTMKTFAQAVATRLAGTPGVHGVTYSTNGLFAGTESNDDILVPGYTDAKHRDAFEDYVGPDYFQVVGIPILAGRGIEAQDTATSNRAAVVNEAMVKQFFHGQNPIGRQFTIDDIKWRDKPLTIVGVSHNAKDHGNGMREGVKPRFYMAYLQVPEPEQLVIEAQVSGAASAAASTVLSQLKAVDPHVPISFTKALDTLVNESAANEIALAKLTVFFAGLALLLACIGLYGVISYTVAGRTREIGVRMALGAARSDVLQLVLREGMLLVATGILIGVPLSLASGQILETFLFGLKPTDPLSLLAVAILLGLVAAFAAFIPARRASKVDPIVALRYE